MNYEDILREAEALAIGAGDILLGHWGNISSVTYKNKESKDNDIKTIADEESEAFIVSGIKKAFPEHGVFAEENVSENLDREFVWYVDPLDGTANFSRHMPMFAVSVGVVHNGEPVVGVIHFPVLGLTLRASKGDGATANGKPIHVSNRPLDESLYCAGGIWRGQIYIVRSIMQAAPSINIFTSSSFDLSQIAMGNAEIYFLDNVPHDVVAGICIVREAGGRVSDGYGQPWSLKSKHVLITNERIHKEVESLLIKDDKYLGQE
jgi:myo-inositol-1(or 4)-monophosphatase